MGEQLFDERLTLVDDPFHEEGAGGGLYDGEGVPTQKRAIIEKGVVNGFQHTLSTAKRCGHEPTGNAQRSVSSLPNPGMHNLVMAHGEGDLDEMLKQAEGGLYVSQMLGTFTSNFLAGQVSGNISLGFLIDRVAESAAGLRASCRPQGRTAGAFSAPVHPASRRRCGRVHRSFVALCPCRARA